MRNETLKYLLAPLTIAMLAFQAPAQAGGDVETKHVDCEGPNPESIQEEVDEADPPTTIFITGTCIEEVNITKDDITLSGNESGDHPGPGGTGTIVGTVNIVGAARAKIEFLTVTGPGKGITVAEGGSAKIERNEIVDNTVVDNAPEFKGGTGVDVRNDSFADIVRNVITGNGQGNPFFDCGVAVLHNSTATSRGNLVADNGFCAVAVEHASHFENGLFIPRNREVSPDPMDLDVLVVRGCERRAAAGSCGSEFGDAMFIDKGSSVNVNNVEITGEVELYNGSTFDGRNGEIFGNIVAVGSAGVRAQQRTSENPPRVIVGNGQITCIAGSYTLYDTSGDLGCGDVIPSPPGP